MRIIEVRDGFIKIESTENLALSSFVEIKDSVKSYIAQIQQVKKAGDYTIAYAKCIFLYDGNLVNYDKTLPNINSEIKVFKYEDLKNSFEYKKPIVVGSFINNNLPIFIEEEYLNKKTLINIETKENINIVLKNIAKQFKNSIIIDTAGIIDGEKFIAGVDFKLPLNTTALEFMFEDCLNDATSDSKSLIKEIFQDLSNYSKTVPFLPFGTLKTIVDDMVNKSHVFKLLVLKNKLAKFDQLGYFAKTIEEAENLKEILTKQNAVIDLSKLDHTFLNRYLNVIYSTIETLSIKPQVFVYATNSINKKNLKTILTGDVSSTFATHSRFKYINEIKSMFSNFIIEPNFANNENFKRVSSLLPLIKNNSYLICGEGTNYIPFVSNVNEFDYNIEEYYKNSEPEIQVEDLNAQNLINLANIDATNIEDKELEVIVENISDEELQNEFNETIQDETISAIERKSDELIERISEEILEDEKTFDNNIFDNETEDCDDIKDSEMQISEDSINIEPEKTYLNTSDYTEEFHTEIDETKIIEVSEDLSQIVDEEFERLETFDKEPKIKKTEKLELLDSFDSEDIAIIAKEDDNENNIDNCSIDNYNNNSESNVVEVNEEIITDIKEDAQIQFENEVEKIEDLEQIEDFTNNLEENKEETITISDDFIEILDETTDTSLNEDFVETFDNSLEEPIVEDFIQEDEDNINILKEESEEKNILSVDSIEDYEEIGEFIELDDDSELPDDLIVVDIDNEEELSETEDLDRAIVEDVDKVFTTIKEDSISDSDLDFIDELNNSINNDEEVILSDGMEELTDFQEIEDSDNGFIEPLEEVNDFIDIEDDEKEILEVKNSSTPTVPVYDAEIPNEDIVMSDAIEQGDTVYHAKYGNGVVEKMIKYGSKSLYSINFDNVGRRLLDPTLTEIKKS